MWSQSEENKEQSGKYGNLLTWHVLYPHSQYLLPYSLFIAMVIMSIVGLVSLLMAMGVIMGIVGLVSK
jgi:hypothetical protein